MLIRFCATAFSNRRPFSLNICILALLVSFAVTDHTSAQSSVEFLFDDESELDSWTVNEFATFTIQDGELIVTPQSRDDARASFSFGSYITDFVIESQFRFLDQADDTFSSVLVYGFDSATEVEDSWFVGGLSIPGANNTQNDRGFLVGGPVNTNQEIGDLDFTEPIAVTLRASGTRLELSVGNSGLLGGSSSVTVSDRRPLPINVDSFGLQYGSAANLPAIAFDYFRVTAVPEPASSLLCLSGLVGLLSMRRRRT